MPERPRPIVVEVCVDDVGGTAAARLGGATPTIGFVRRAAAQAGPLGLQVVGAACSM